MAWSRWKYRHVFGILAYVAAWMVIFLSFWIAGWPGKIKKCVSTQTCFCENVDLNSIWGQPVSSLTNFAYIVSAVSIVVYLTRAASVIPMNEDDYYNKFKKITACSFLYAILVATIGIGSLFMHASQRTWTGLFDVYAMNLFIVFVFIYSIAQFRRASLKQLLITYATIEAVMLVVYLLARLKENAIFGMITAVTVCWEVIYQVDSRRRRRPYRRDWRFLALSITAFLGGFIAWELEDFGITPCDPYSLVQVHGFWHVITAVATFFIFLYVKSETKVHDLDATKMMRQACSA